ncbi:amino acid ABC transporter substrate-binding protein [Pararhizobium haloflavum]|uniref:amino acid ABC transporter substrate-binding protein n=1 Tax=Pararhizobium haloflavum TaxID=2037914 RepID=UPI000C19445F|nr:amino acid ABC transporter substrate-binding protein [Pararhizobium haloflavum]
MTKIILSAAAGAVALGLGAQVASAQTLESVQENGYVQCGVSTGLAGFSNTDDAGDWTGLDVDYCRALAAAIFDDPEAVRFTPLSAVERFTALQSGEIDVLSRNTTWTMSRDTDLGLNFVGVTFYDGQGFMVPKELEVTSALQLSGASVCVQSGTTTELNLTDYFNANNMDYNPVVFEGLEEVNAAYNAGRCDVYTTDSSGLASIRLQLDNPDDHMILPELISKEPLGPSVRQGDEQWFDIAKWVYYALVSAEELGVNSENVEEMTESENPDIRRLVGSEGTFGEDIGLENDWALKAIKHVGNYGEIFERNVGPETPLQIERGLNALYTDGGVQYAMPVR